MIARELPLDHPGLLTISWITEAILGVCWSAPAAPTVVHALGLHETAAAVLALEETLFFRLVNVVA